MNTSDFDYDLPEELIAQTPLEPRDASRLLVVDRSAGSLAHRCFRDVLEYLRPGDLLVGNDSRVIQARLHGHKEPGGGRLEVLLLAKRADRVWEALTRGRHIRAGTVIQLDRPEHAGAEPPAGRVLEVTEAGSRLIEWDSPIEAWLDLAGSTPLPPYIHTPLANPERYQTVYARAKGSVAAPTAGLHFTPALLDDLRARGIETAFVTLHIGLDTFRPVKEDRVEEHQIHTEYCLLSADTADRINAARAAGRRIVAVGTTAVRVLESAGQLAANAGHGWAVAPMAGATALYIYPGYQFRVVDALLTNFHLPRSTLLMLVSAFAGRELILRAYGDAIRERYRFYSFGDAMLIL